MSQDRTIYHVDSMTIDGKNIGIEDSSATINGAARFANTVVVAASGPDAQKRGRVPTTIEANILFTPGVNIDDFTGLSGVQVVLKDRVSGRRVLSTNTSFGTIGEIGSGPVKVTLNVLEPLQWL